MKRSYAGAAPDLVADFEAVNAKGGQATGKPLATWAAKQKRGEIPLVLLLSEVDGPGGSTRVYDALRDGGFDVYGHPHGQTHGEREVAVAVLGPRFHVEAFRCEQLTPNTNPHDGKHPWQWYGPGQDRWLAIVEGRFLGVRYAVLSTHAPLGMFTKRGRLNHTPQARSWRKARRKIARLVKGYQKAGHVVVLGGDLNEQHSKRRSGTARWGRRLRMRPFVSHVMWLLVSGRAVDSHAAVSCPADVSDHKTAVKAAV